MIPFYLFLAQKEPFLSPDVLSRQTLCGKQLAGPATCTCAAPWEDAFPCNVHSKKGEELFCMQNESSDAQVVVSCFACCTYVKSRLANLGSITGSTHAAGEPGNRHKQALMPDARILPTTLVCKTGSPCLGLLVRRRGGGNGMAMSRGTHLLE